MKTTSNFTLTVVCLALLTSCSGVMSSVHYTNGTGCLCNGDYAQAVIDLEKAVKADPEMARNHTNLSIAYLGCKNTEKGWYHIRQAVRCPYDDGICRLQFLKACKLLIEKPGFNKPGTSQEEIITALGTPDEINENEKHEIVTCTYGTYQMTFENGKLVSTKIK